MLASKVMYEGGHIISAGPLGHLVCGTALYSILHSSLFPVVVLRSLVLLPLPCGAVPLPCGSVLLF